MKTMRALAIMAAVSVSVALAVPAGASELRVTVAGLRSAEGTVHVAVWNDADTFPDSDRFLHEVIVPARTEGAVAVFPDLPPGTYAAATFHDENQDGEFDQGFMGVPLEGYAFSNDVRPLLAPPAFDDAAVSVGDGATEIRITMKY